MPGIDGRGASSPDGVREGWESHSVPSTSLHGASASSEDASRRHPAAALRRFTLDNRLRKALERGELYLHYQPQLDLVNGRIDAVEALLRWENPELGMVSPAEFIPLTHENGQIIPIGEWVLCTACAQAKAWQDAGVGLSRIAVNISAVHFVQPNCTDCIAQTLEATGLAPDALELEPLLRRSAIDPAGQDADPSSRQILMLVDDDTELLDALTKSPDAEAYRMLTAVSAREAFDLLARYRVQVVLANHLMPE